MPLLENLQKEYPNDLVLLAVNLQEPIDEVRRYVDAQRIRSRVLLDQEGRVGSTYGSESIPMQVLIDQKGIVRDVQVGFSPSMGSRLRGEVQKLLGS
jgi:thiol-disulfide isomerase/thioredoxin